MIIYKCRFTGDEMCSDAFKPEDVIDPATGEAVPGLFEVKSTKVNKDSGASIDVGGGNAFGGGEEEDLDDTVEVVNNVIDSSIGFDLHEIPIGKKDFKEYLQSFCKKTRQALKDDESVPGPEVKKFTQSAPLFCKFLLTMYSDLQFYTSSQMDPDGSMAYSYYKEGDVNPTFIYIKGGLIEEKC